MANKIIVLNVCNCKENKKNVSIGQIFDENKIHNCLNCGYYQNYNEITIEINEKNKIIWSTVS